MGNQNSRDRSSQSMQSAPVRNSRGLPPTYERPPQLPVTTKALNKGADARLAYGVGSMQGWRDSMEDAHAALLRLPLPAELQTLTEKQFSFFGVYDGHGGDEVSKYLAENLHTRIARDPSFRRNDFRNAIKQGFYLTDNEMRSDPVVGNCDAGATTMVGLITPEDVLYIGNAGDCRAVLCSAGEAIALSMDHKPTLPTETARIKRAGGVVEDDRVEGDLAVSRALGDFEYKSHPDLPLNEQMVSPEPDVVERRLNENDEFLILACDGIWDVVSNKEASDFVRTRVAEGLDLDVVCAQLMDRCIAREPNEIGIGCDNMTVVIVGFLMGKQRKQWRENIKKRMGASGAVVSSTPEPVLAGGLPGNATSSTGSYVDTLTRGSSGSPVAGTNTLPETVEVSMPRTQTGGSYVDTLPRSNTALKEAGLEISSTTSSSYVDTLSRPTAGKIVRRASDYTAYSASPVDSTPMNLPGAPGAVAASSAPQQPAPQQPAPTASAGEASSAKYASVPPSSEASKSAEPQKIGRAFRKLFK